MSAAEVADYIATAEKAREGGRSYVFALVEGSEVLGVCRLIGLLGVPRLIVAVGGAYRGKGNGSILVRHVLTFAFEKLKIDLVTASGPCLRLVSQFGRLHGNGLTRTEWHAGRAKGG
jgi:RimJ/RimL family protein N-acetyltransferase